MEDSRAQPSQPRTDHDIARQYLASLGQRRASADQNWRSPSERLADLDAGSLAYLRGVIFLGGHAPGPDLDKGDSYDARFLSEKLLLLPYRMPEILVEIPYTDIETVDISGPGLVKSGGGFAGGGFGLMGALEGAAIAALLNSLTTRYTVKTVIRVHAKTAELFLLETSITPENLRMDLSRALAAIRDAKPDDPRPPAPASEAPKSVTLIGELEKLTSLLERGAVTREEFERLKAALLADL